MPLRPLAPRSSSPAPAAAQGLAPVGATAIESRLCERARAGDAEAFRHLFLRHGPAVRRLLGDLLGDPEAADEATQETFVRAYHGLGELRDGAKLRPWLLGIARNVFYEELRRRKRLGAAPRPSADLGEDTPPPAEPADDLGDPETLLIGREAEHVLQEALADLGAERRTALLLRLDHQLDYEEIQTVMGWNLAKVKNEIHRARLALRARLLPYLGGR